LLPLLIAHVNLLYYYLVSIDHLKLTADYNVKPIDLNFKPSFILSIAIFLMSVMSSWIVYVVNLSLSIQCFSLLLIWIAAIYAIIKDGLLLFPWSLAKLHVNAKNQLNVIRKDGQVLSDLSLKDDSVVTPLLTIVHFRPKNTTWATRLFNQRFIILADSVDAEAFRQLRVWLLWGENRK
jgi:toxin CptA